MAAAPAAVSPQPMIPSRSDNPALNAKVAAKRSFGTQKFVDAAASLAQADRHLTARPLEVRTASDFVLGPLFSEEIESAEITIVKIALNKAISDKKLPLDFLSAAAKETLPVVLGSTLERCPDITGVRFASTQFTPDQNLSLQFSVYTQTGRAEALAILAQVEGIWKIEHISLDSAALFLPYTPLKDFDPYGILVSPR